jgi:GDP/UDP-N,N'-diacetylbacillosamine 2-epimerase (hydrolysing)
MIDGFVERNNDHSVVFTSLGQLNYLSVMKNVDAVVGNSSSGIFEAGGMHVYAVNIGDRQKGRIKGENIIDCLPDADSIIAALKHVFYADYRLKNEIINNPYGDGTASVQILNLLKELLLQNFKYKYFFNINNI